MRGFLFLRHGETDWNLAKRMQGQVQGIPLNQTGIVQAKRAASLLASHVFDLIVSSTLDRAVQTAHIIAEPRNTPIVFDKRLIERNGGIAEGHTCEELGVANYSEFFSVNPEGAETKEELEARASEAVTSLLGAYKDRTVLLVTHTAWLRALVHRLTGEHRSFPNAVPFVATEEQGGWRVGTL